MLQNITFSAEKSDIEAAREYASQAKTTLNDMFREWLAHQAKQELKRRKKWEREFDVLMDRLSYVQPGRKFSRDEMNER